MKLSDLFKKKKKKEEPESVESNHEDPKIFEQAESYTSILENIDSEEEPDLITEDLSKIVAEGERIIGRKREKPEEKKSEESEAVLFEETLFEKVDLEAEKSNSEDLSSEEPEKENLESPEDRFKTGPIFEIMQNALKKDSDEAKESTHDIRIVEKSEIPEESRNKESRRKIRRSILLNREDTKVRESDTGFIIVENEELAERDRIENFKAQTEIRAKKFARRRLSETQEILALTGETEPVEEESSVDLQEELEKSAVDTYLKEKPIEFFENEPLLAEESEEFTHSHLEEKLEFPVESSLEREEPSLQPPEEEKPSVKEPLTESEEPKSHFGKIRTRSAFEEVLELKRKKRALEARNEINQAKKEEAEERVELAEVKEEPVETAPEIVEEKSEQEKTKEIVLTPSRKEKKSPFSKLFKRKKKTSKEETKVFPKISKPVPEEPVKETESPQRSPRRRRRSELLLTKSEEPKKTEKKTETIELSIVKEEEKQPKSSSLLDALEAKPVLEESLKQSIEDSQKLPKVPEEKKPQRNKNIKRQLRREERVNRERDEKKVQELTANFETVGSGKEPLIFSKVPDNILKGGIVLFNNLARQMQSSGTLRVESLFSVLGSLAGYSIQEGIREKMVNRMGLSEDQVFSIVETKSNDRYFFGDPIDRSLQKERSSLWYMTAGATQRLTGKVEVNIDEVIRYTMRNVGKESFGVPRLPKSHRPNHTPRYYVEHMWEALVPGLERFTNDPLQWYLVFCVSLQRALICTKDLINPNVALRIIIESAVPMSVADLRPLKPSELVEETSHKPDISVLRKEIEFIRKTLETNLPQDQRSVLIKELSIKTERLYDLLDTKGNDRARV